MTIPALVMPSTSFLVVPSSNPSVITSPALSIALDIAAIAGTSAANTAAPAKIKKIVRPRPKTLDKPKAASRTAPAIKAAASKTCPTFQAIAIGSSMPVVILSAIFNMAQDKPSTPAVTAIIIPAPQSIMPTANEAAPRTPNAYAAPKVARPIAAAPSNTARVVETIFQTTLAVNPALIRSSPIFRMPHARSNTPPVISANTTAPKAIMGYASPAPASAASPYAAPKAETPIKAAPNSTAIVVLTMLHTNSGVNPIAVSR